jgi:hypothetical protein
MLTHTTAAAIPTPIPIRSFLDRFGGTGQVTSFSDVYSSHLQVGLSDTEVSEERVGRWTLMHTNVKSG